MSRLLAANSVKQDTSYGIQKFKDWQIRNYKFAYCFYGYETWSLTLRKERRLNVFENRVLRITFGPKRDEVTGEWRNLHNEELIDLYFSPNIARVIKSRRMRWAGSVARMGIVGAYTEFWLGNLRKRDHLKDSVVDGRIISRCIFRKWDVGTWTGSSWLRTGTDGGHLWMR